MAKTECIKIGIVTGLVLLSSHVRLASCQKALSDGISDLASQISSSVAQQQKKRVAVIPFRELDGRTTVLGTYLSEELGTDLFKLGGLDIVERTMLDRILGELKLGQSGLVDPTTAKKIGEVAGVDAIVTGTITDLESFVAVNCRLIDVQTGRVFAAAQTRILKDDDVKKIMGVEIGQASPPTDRSVTPTNPQPVPSTRLPEFSNRAVRVQVISAGRTGAGLRLGLLVTNRLTQPLDVQFRRSPGAPDGSTGYFATYLTDESGRRYDLAGGSGFSLNVCENGGCTGGSRLSLEPETPLRVELDFDAVDQSARSVTLVWPTFENRVVIRNIPLRAGR